MSGLTTEIELDLGKAGEALTRLSEIDLADITYVIGQLVEDQTKRRISDERQSPEGEDWPAWSKGYAETRHGGHSLLVGEGHLQNSIQNYTTADRVTVGSNLIYAAIHQFGGTIVPKNAEHLVFMLGDRKVFAQSVTIPARPWLGLSSENRQEIEDLVICQLEDLLQ